MLRFLPALAAALVIAARAAPAAGGADPSGDPARLVFLLEYVGTDYAAAVRNGEIIDQLEYGEALRFTRQILSEYQSRASASDAVAAGLRELLALIERRAAPDDVGTAARRLLPDFARRVGGLVVPPAQPNLASGARLWASDCAPCHGISGQGDGPLAFDLLPPPLSLHADRRLDQLSPRQIYSAATFGIDGTAMPSFVPAYSERQRWDVAFYALTLRAGFNPSGRPRPPLPTLEALAGASNQELLLRLREQQPEATAEMVDYLRANVPERDDAAAAVPAMAAALQLQDAFAAVAERVFPHVVGIWGYQRATAAPAATSTPAGGWTSSPPAASYPGFRALRPATGFLVGDEGFVFTRNAAVRDDRGGTAAFVIIETDDGLELLGRVVGSEPSLDLAVLQLVDPGRLAPRPAELEIGDSDRLRAGHWMIAAGAPPGPNRVFGFGLVAATPTRQCYQEELSATLLQGSLTVPANGLGGPVMDIQGRVIGISIALAPPAASGLASGTTTVLPINLAMNLFEALRVAESNRSPWLGVSVLELHVHRQRLAPADQQRLPAHGLLLDNVFAPSPAARAGVRAGDILVELAGHPIATVSDFQTWLYVSGVGTACELKLLRNGKPLSLTLTIEPRPPAATTR